MQHVRTVGSTLKIAARVSGIVIWWTVLLTGLGLVLSFGGLALLWDDVASACGDRAFVRCGPGLLVDALFLLVFPVAFYMVAVRYGVQRGLHFLYTGHRDFLVSYLRQKLDEFLARPQVATTLAAQLSQAQAAEQLLAGYLRRLPAMPRALRWVFRHLLRRLSFTEGLHIEPRPDGQPLSAADLSGQLARQLEAQLSETFVAPDPRLYLALMGVVVASYAGASALI